MEQFEHEPDIKTIILLTITEGHTLEYDLPRRQVRRDGKLVNLDLTVGEHELFLQFITHRNLTLTYKNLQNFLNPGDHPIYDSPNEQNKYLKEYIGPRIFRLRGKLKRSDPLLAGCIKNVWGVGYMCHL